MENMAISGNMKNYMEDKEIFNFYVGKRKNKLHHLSTCKE